MSEIDPQFITAAQAKEKAEGGYNFLMPTEVREELYSLMDTDEEKAEKFLQDFISGVPLFLNDGGVLLPPHHIAQS